MKERISSNHADTRMHYQGKMYVLKLGGFWGNLIAIVAFLLMLPFAAAFFLFFVIGFAVLAVLGIGYTWWQMRKFRQVRATHYEDDTIETIELAASDYHELEKAEEKDRDPE